MLNPVTIAVVAASVWAAVALALPANAVAKNAEATPAATSTDVTARGQATAPVAKRVRRASMQPRRVAAVVHLHRTTPSASSSGARAAAVPSIS